MARVKFFFCFVLTTIAGMLYSEKILKRLKRPQHNVLKEKVLEEKYCCSIAKERNPDV